MTVELQRGLVFQARPSTAVLNARVSNKRSTCPNTKRQVKWTFSGGDFVKGSYSREHTWTFDGGVTVPASPAPSSVKVPYSNPANVDPEEAYVASISSCHMLTFLWVASRKGFEVKSYQDDAVGVMTKNERGSLWVSSVVLHPRIEYGGPPPAPEVEEALHHQAHEGCYIANSVKTEITVAIGSPQLSRS